MCDYLVCLTIELIHNKRLTGHITNLRKQFKSINTLEQSNDNIITLIRRGKKTLTSL